MQITLVQNCVSKLRNKLQGQSSLKFIEILMVLRFIFCPNLEILISIDGEWLRVQAQNMVNLYFKFDYAGQDQLTAKTTGI